VARTPSHLTRDVKREARRLGFDLVAITTADDFVDAKAVFLERLNRGLFDGMDWMSAERAQRASSPGDHVSGARSIIALASSYWTVPDIDLSRPGDPHGRVARYAWGPDYHGFVADRAKALAAYLREEHGAVAQPKACVDTVALLERAVAQRSGLGWFGKSTMLLTSAFGTWVFLAEVITDLELESDVPRRTTCGSCRACMDACPTGALDHAYELDARLCISYLTIENRQAIPRALRPAIGTWIFGCDVCQSVCPVNRAAKPGDLARLVGGGGIGPSPALLPILRIDERGFRERFRYSAVRRVKRAGLARNVCVALGNCGDPAAIGPLSATLVGDPEPLVREHAAWALGRFPDQLARSLLDASWRGESEPSVRDEIERSLDA